MATLGRKPRSIPRQKRHLRIREDIAATVDLLLLDPMREKVAYGKWSDLVEMLLRSWIAEQRSGKLRFTLSHEDIRRIKELQTILDVTPTSSLETVTMMLNAARKTLREVFGDSPTDLH